MIFSARLHHAYAANGDDRAGVRDGDTAWFALQGPTLQGVQHHYVIKGRFHGLDADKRGTARGDEAHAFVLTWLMEAAIDTHDPAWPLTIETHGAEKYGRELVSISRADGQSLNRDLLLAKLATAWDGQGARRR